MKVKLRILLVCLIYVLIVNFSACGNGKISTDDNSPLKGNKNTDLNGRTISVGIPDYLFPLEDGPSIDTDYKKKLNKIMLERKNEVEKKYSCKIEWNTKLYNSYKKTLREIRESKHVADIIYCLPYSIDIIDLIANKCIIPLDDYINYDSGVYGTEAQDCSLWKDKHYGIAPNSVNHGYLILIYNKDILMKEGLPDPMELQRDNQWTWEVFLDMLKTTTKDLNGDGVTDQWGFIYDKYQEVFGNILFSNNGKYIEYKNGKFQLELNSPESTEAIQFAQNLYKTYKVSPDPVANPMSSEQIAGIFKSGNCVFTDYRYFEQELPDSSLNTGIVVFPKGTKAENYIQLANPGGFFAVPSTVDNQEDMVAVMSDLFSLHDPSKGSYISEADFLESNVSSSYVDTYKIASKNIRYTWLDDVSSQYGKMLRKIFSDIMLNDKSFDDAISAERSTLDKFVNALNQSN